MSWWAAKTATKVVGASARAGGRAGQSFGDSLASNMALRAASKGARRGFLAPGDPTPPPSATMDYLDYRGTAHWKEASNLTDGQFPLGAFSDLNARRGRGPIGVPPVVMNRHSLVVGPNGSGKTHSLLIPWMYAALASNWSVVAVDVKGDLREDFLDFKERYGEPGLGAGLTKWDFLDPRGSRPWEWLGELTDDARVDKAITALLGRRPEGGSTDPFFYQRDYRTLRGLLRFAPVAAPHVRTASDLMRLLEDDIALDALVKQHTRAPGASDLQAVLRQPQADYPKLISGVVTALSALDTPSVNAVTRASSARPSINLDRALEEHHMLIIGAALQGGDISSTQSSLMLNQLSQRLYERFGQQRRPVLLVIDEAKQVIERVDIAQLMEVARSAGVAVVVALQDVAQIKEQADRESIVTNAATFAVLPGAGTATVKAFSDRLGTRFERTMGMSTDTRRSWGSAPPTQNLGTESVPVLREREIIQPPVGQRAAVVHIKAQAEGVTGKPFLVDMQRD